MQILTKHPESSCMSMPGTFQIFTVKLLQPCSFVFANMLLRVCYTSTRVRLKSSNAFVKIFNCISNFASYSTVPTLPTTLNYSTRDCDQAQVFSSAQHAVSHGFRHSRLWVTNHGFLCVKRRTYWFPAQRTPRTAQRTPPARSQPTRALETTMAEMDVEYIISTPPLTKRGRA